MNLVWDLTLYLVCLQLILLQAIWFEPVSATDSRQQHHRLTWFFASSMAVLWLVWGGYSVDAWRYLSRFDRNPLHFFEEQLFWVAGHSLGLILPDPWPLKVMSALFAILVALAYRWHYRQGDWRLPLAFMLLLATPGFLLLGGNVIRQGLAGAIGIVAAAWLLRGGSWRWALLFIPAFLVHQASLVFFVALLAVRLTGRHLVWIWAAAFVVSPLIQLVVDLTGFNLNYLIAHSSEAEGQYHWEKLYISALLSLVVVASTLAHRSGEMDFRHIYLALVSCCHALLLFEVPFERLLLFADLAAPAALVQVLWLHHKQPRILVRLLTLLVVTATAVLWNAHSILLTLGLLWA